MEFQFNVNEYFKKPIVEIRNTLLPPDFAGDRRALWNTVNKVAEVVNEMGEASANAQGLNKPITSAERLRQSEQSLYLMVDPSANNGNGAITGMLKVGRKGLYVFDREGQHYQVTPPCVLDFYVHEKRQRSGLGRKLFEYMLERENIKPHNLAIDRPSEKFLSFLRKHYDLQSPIKQMNNYVVFDGFFPDGKKEKQSEDSPMNRTNGLQSAYNHNTPSYGRYGAPRPPCSMGQIIHNTTSQKNSESASQNSCHGSNMEQPKYSLQLAQYQQDSTRTEAMNSEVNKHLSNSFGEMRNAPVNSHIEMNNEQIVRKSVQQPLQEQFRMFPEKEKQTTNSTPCPQYSIGSPPTDQDHYMMNQSGQVWQTRPQPHISYQMPQTPPNTSYFNQFNRQDVIPRTAYNTQYQGIREGHFPLQYVSNQLPSYQESSQQPDFHTSDQPTYHQNSFHAIESNMQQPILPSKYIYDQQQYVGIPQQFNQQLYPHQQLQQPFQPYPIHLQQHNSGNCMASGPTAWTTLDNVHRQNPGYYQENTHLRKPTSYQIRLSEPSSLQEQRTSVQNRTALSSSEYTNVRPPSSNILTSHEPHSQQSSTNEKIEPDTVRSLLQVDPKYFKPDPIQLKQPIIAPNQLEKTSKHNKDDTVASLLKAEEEVFENGMLREEYRIPLKLEVAPPFISQDHHKYCTQKHDEFRNIQLQENPKGAERGFNEGDHYSSRNSKEQIHSNIPNQKSALETTQELQERYLPYQITPTEKFISPHSNQHVPQEHSERRSHSHHSQKYISEEQSPTHQLSSEERSLMEKNQINDSAKSRDEQIEKSVVKVPVNTQYCTENFNEKAIEIKQDTQEVDPRIQPQKIVEKELQQIESNIGLSRYPTTIRQSSYIPFEINTHAEGDVATVSTSKQEFITHRKKGFGRQYGLNDVDMRQKGYKSAIVKRNMEVQEHETLEFGYPPQRNKKRPPPRTVLTMRGR